MLADKLEAISTDLEEIQGSLTGVRNIIAKRAISRVLNDLDDVYNELTSTEYHEQQQTLKEQTEKMKQRVIAEVIGELEEREESYYRNFWGDTKFLKSLSHFDGFLFLQALQSFYALLPLRCKGNAHHIRYFEVPPLVTMSSLQFQSMLL